MNIKFYPVVSADDLRKEMKLQYDVDIEPRELFGLEVGDDEYAIVSISKGADEMDVEYVWDVPGAVALRTLVRTHLRDLLPEWDFVMMDY
jgi:hypothetical protein